MARTSSARRLEEKSRRDVDVSSRALLIVFSSQPTQPATRVWPCSAQRSTSGLLKSSRASYSVSGTIGGRTLLRLVMQKPFMNRGLNIGIEIAGRGDRARGLAWGNATLLQVSPRIGGVTEGDSRHACAEASISTFDELRLFNRDRPAVAADQARRGEGGGEHALPFETGRASGRERVWQYV